MGSINKEKEAKFIFIIVSRSWQIKHALRIYDYWLQNRTWVGMVKMQMAPMSREI